MASIDYNDPNDPWRTPGYDPYKGMSDKQKFLASLGQVIGIVLGMVVAIILCALLFSSCTTTKYVPVQQQHTEHHWHKDSVMITDSVISEKETTIMQLDSSAMAQYGIQLKEAEKAWLVRTAELERQIKKIINLSSTNDTVRDSIPYPVEVVKEVPATLTWWQQLRINVGGIIIFLLIGMLCWWMGGLLRKLLHK